MLWWKSAVLYQIYPSSFQDSDGDGVRDLAGIRARLPDLTELGVDALWLSPIFASPMADFGYDISLVAVSDRPIKAEGDVLAYMREQNSLRFVVALNFGRNAAAFTLPEERGTIAVSVLADRSGEKVQGRLKLSGNDGLLIKQVAPDPSHGQAVKGSKLAIFPLFAP